MLSSLFYSVSDTFAPFTLHENKMQEIDIMHIVAGDRAKFRVRCILSRSELP